MAESINIRIETSSDLKAIDQLITRMKKMRQEIEGMTKGLDIGAGFAREINKAVAANKKLEGSVKSLSRTQAAADREQKRRWAVSMRSGQQWAKQIEAATKKAEAAELKWMMTEERLKNKELKLAADTAKKKEQAELRVLANQERAHNKAISLAEQESNRLYKIKMNSINLRNKQEAEAAQAYEKYLRDEATAATRFYRERDRLEQAQNREEIANAKEYAKFQEQLRKQEEAGDRAYIQFQRNIARDNDRIAREEMNRLRQVAQARQQAMTSFRQSLSGLSQTLGTMMMHINRFITVIGVGFNRALATASRTIGTLASSAGSAFARLRSYLDSTGKSFLNFGNLVGRSMKQGTDSMQRFYAAGFSLLASGAILNRLGDRIFGAMGNMVGGYMDYEKMLTRTAISAALPSDMAGQYPGGQYGGQRVRPDFVQDLVFGLQRGQFGKPVMGFNATDLAQGLYFYTSAVGQAITPDNMGQLGPIVADILQVASATQTSPETMIKGVINAAQEFGIDPRSAVEGNKQMQDLFGNLAAQMGYLANITTMEVPDIVEAFKMVGPMAHILTDRNAPGAGLNEMFALTALASEMGLRGGNVGRGINQALTTLLDPTDKAVATAAEAFGIGASKEAFRAFFFNAEGELQGGIPGLFDKLSTLPAEKAAPFLATLFTTNATRSILAIEQAIRQRGGMGELIEEIAGMDAQQWAEMARDAVNNTLYGSFQNLKNAWFQVQASIVDGIKGPLIAAFKAIANVLFSISDVLENNPGLARFIGALMGAAGVVATFAGGLLVLMGTLLLLARGFAMVGAAAHPFFILMTALPRILLILSPILLLLAGAAVALYTAWTHNFMGMRDAVEGFTKSFNFDQTIMPIVNNVIVWLTRFARAFMELINGIVIGIGPTNNLGALLQSIFGPLVGNYMYSGLLRFGRGLEGARESFVKLITSLRSGALVFGNIARTLQGFIEQLFGFEAQQANVQAQDLLGRALGIDNLSAKLQTAGTTIRSWVFTVIAYFKALRDAIFGVQQQMGVFGAVGAQIGGGGIAGSIAANLHAITDSLSGADVRGALRELIRGIAEGFAAAIIGAAKAVEALTRGLANAGRAGRWITDQTRLWTGFSLTLNNVARILGVVIGTWLGARLIAALTPGITLFLRFGTVVAQLAIGLGAGALQLALFAARIAVSAAAISLEVGATTALVGARVALFGITTGVALVQAAYNVSQGTGVIATVLQTIATEALAAALSTVLVVLLAVAAAGALLATIGLAITAIFTTVAAVMLVQAFNAGGLVAVWAGLVQLYNGFMSVAQPVINVIMAVGSAIVSATQWFLDLIGVGHDFYAVGQLIAVGLGIILAGIILVIAALASLALTLVAAFIASNALWIGIAAGAIAIALLLDHFGLLDDVVNGAVDTFNWMYDTIVATMQGLGSALTVIWSAITGDIDAVANATISLVLHMVEVINQALSAINFARSGLNKIPGVNIPEVGLISTSGLEAVQAAYENTQKHREVVSSSMAGIGDVLNQIERQTEAKTGQHSSIMKRIIEKAGLGEILKKYGIDAEHLSVGELKQMFSLDSFDKMSQQYSAGSIMPWMKQYQEDVDAYQRWQDMVAKRGYANAKRFYEANDIPIPQPPDLNAYITGTKDQFEEINSVIEEETAKFEQFSSEFASALQGIDLGTLLDAAFAKTPGDKTVAGWLGANAKTLVGNIGDAAPWMTETELLIDAALSGGLSQGIEGVNIHKALQKPLARVSEQTGVSINDMLKDVPKFVYSEDALPFVVEGMVEEISTWGPVLGDKIDLLGKDIGKGIEGMGLDWAEVAQYAISKGMAGQDWNFVDYIADAWDMSRADAVEYLRSHNINPEIISNALLPPEVQEYLKNGAGQYSTITADAYDFLQQHVLSETDKLIQVTQQEWDNLSTIQKAAFTKMGYTFIIAGEDVSASAVESVNNVLNSFREAWGDDPTARYQMVKDLGNGWVELKNILDGTTVTVPAVEWESYRNSVKEVERLTNLLKGIVTNPFKDVGEGTATNKSADDLVDLVMGGKSGTAGGKTSPAQDTGTTQGEAYGTGLATGISNKQSEISTAVTNSLTTAVEDSVTTVSTTVDLAPLASAMASNLETILSNSFASALQNALNSAITQMGMSTGGGEYDVASGTMGAAGAGPFDSIFKGYADSAATAFQGELNSKMPGTVSAGTMYGAGGTGSTGGAAVQTEGPFDSIFKGYATTAITAFKTQLVTDYNTKISSQTAFGFKGVLTKGPFDTIFQGYGTTAANAFKTAVESALAGWTPSMPTGQEAANQGAMGAPPTAATAGPTLTAKLTLDRTAFDTEMWAAIQAGLGIQATTFITHLALERVLFDAELWNAITAALGFQATTFTTKLDADENPATNALNSMVTALETYELDTFTTTLDADTSLANAALDAINSRLDSFDSRWATASVGLNDYASIPLNSIIAKLDAIDGRHVTSTVTNTTNNITNNTTNNKTQTLARGGIVDSIYQIVGEKGAELAQLPMGTRIFTAQDTRKMFEKVADAVQYMNGTVGIVNVESASAKAQRPLSNITTSDAFANARQMEIRTHGQGGDIKIEIGNLTISKEVDIDKAFARVDRLIGRKTELARRGMLPYDEARKV